MHIWIRANKNPRQAILRHRTRHLTNTQHPHIPSHLYRIPLQRQGIHWRSQLSSCNKSGEQGSKDEPSGEEGRLGGRDDAGCLSCLFAWAWKVVGEGGELDPSEVEGGEVTASEFDVGGKDGDVLCNLSNCAD